MRALVAAVQATPSITVIEGLEARRLLVDDRGIAGVLAAGPADACLLPSRRVVLATGGLGGLYAHTTNPLGAIGQGLALAARAGAALSDLEFVQFHPTALDVGLDPMPLVSEAVRGEGAVLSTRPARASWRAKAAASSRRATSSRGRWRRTSRPAIGSSSMPGRRSARTSPGLPRHHRALPGRRHRSRAPADPRASRGALPHGRRRGGRRGPQHLEGLWACGEVAATGLHGANRLASNSLLEAVVMARAVADSIVGTEPAPLPAARPVALPPAPDVTALRGPISETLGVVRDRAGLEQASAICSRSPSRAEVRPIRRWSP